MIKFYALLIPLFVSGCASYTYTKNGDNCTIEIKSTRSISVGALSIDDQCSIIVSTEMDGAISLIKAVKK